VSDSPQAALLQAASRRILLLDGAVGTLIQRHNLSEADYRGKLFEQHPCAVQGNHDLLVLTQPQLIRDIHGQYLAAGSDLVETNTFNANALSQVDYRLEHHVYSVNLEAARLARSAADEWSDRTPDKRRFVAGAIGPSNRTLSVSSDVNAAASRVMTLDQAKAAYLEQIRGLIDGGADVLLIETVTDTLMCKATIAAAEQVFAEKGKLVPIMISATLSERGGCTLSGQTVLEFWNSVAHTGPLSVGFNCAWGAQHMRPHIEELSRVCDVLVSAYPNAGLPNAFGEYEQLPTQTATLLEDFAKSGFVNILGGCCGTTPDHIRAIAEQVREIEPRQLREADTEMV
jgi:5-methyltetrahydrofolate--homocysteine methyltransferase